IAGWRREKLAAASKDIVGAYTPPPSGYRIGPSKYAVREVLQEVPRLQNNLRAAIRFAVTARLKWEGPDSGTSNPSRNGMPTAAELSDCLPRLECSASNFFEQCNSNARSQTAASILSHSTQHVVLCLADFFCNAAAAADSWKFIRRYYIRVV